MCGLDRIKSRNIAEIICSQMSRTRMKKIKPLWMFPLNYFLPIEITQVHFQMWTKTKNRNNHEHKAKCNSCCSPSNSVLRVHSLFKHIFKYFQTYKWTHPRPAHRPVGSERKTRQWVPQMSLQAWKVICSDASLYLEHAESSWQPWH